MKDKVRCLRGILCLLCLLPLLPVRGLAAATYTPESSDSGAHAMSYTCQAGEGVEKHFKNRYPQLITLGNAWESDHPRLNGGREIRTYRLDAIDASLETGSFTRRNLEDSGMLDWSAAGRIRAILLHTYPRQSLDAMQTRINFWLRSQGEPELIGLQPSEAILGTQAAIWSIAYAETFRIESLYSGSSDLAGQPPSAATIQSIQAVFGYLCALEPAAPKRTLITEDILSNAVCTRRQESDGTFTVSVTIPVYADLDSNDTVTVSAVCGSLLERKPITGQGTYTFQFRGLYSCPDVTLELTGEQRGADVYLYCSDGHTQLVGYDSSFAPISGKKTIDMEPARSMALGGVLRGPITVSQRLSALMVINGISGFLLLAVAGAALAKRRASRGKDA